MISRTHTTDQTLSPDGTAAQWRYSLTMLRPDDDYDDYDLTVLSPYLALRPDGAIARWRCDLMMLLFDGAAA